MGGKKNMYKKILALMMALAVMFAFTGCISSNNEVTVRADGTADVYIDYSIDKAKMDAEIQKDASGELQKTIEQLEAAGFKVEKVNGVEYYTMKNEAKGISVKDAKDVFKEYDSKAKLSAKSFELDLGSFIKELEVDELGDEMSDLVFDISFKVTLPYEIIKTNGKLSANKKTVTWNYKDVKSIEKMYAYTEAMPYISCKKTTAIAGDKIRYLKVKNGTGKIKWSSSNKKVATVTSSGVVKLIKPGKVTITAVQNGKKMNCKVTVVSKEYAAKKAYRELKETLKYPSTLKVNNIVMGTSKKGMFVTQTKVIMFEYSAMNDFGNRVYNNFMAWYSHDGDLCYEEGNYYPGDLLNKVKISKKAIK